MKLTPEKLTAFCAALAETCQVSKACKAVSISRVTAYEWRREIPEFADAWDRALQVGASVLEDEMHRRAVEGVAEPVFYQGEACGTVQKYSDTLLIFSLKAANPAKYRENSRVELTGADGGPVQMADTDRAARIAALLAMAEARREAKSGAGEACGDLDDLV